MAITTVPSAITGQTLSAAQWNTQVRDNINGIWVLTTAGDMLYATGASAAARLAFVTAGVMYGGASAPAWLAPSTNGRHLKMGATYPEWAGYNACKATRVTTVAVNTATPYLVVFTAAAHEQGADWDVSAPTKVTISFTGLYRLFATFSADGGSGYRQADVLKNGTTVIENRVDNAATETTNGTLSDEMVLTAGDYLQLLFQHNNGSTIDLRKASLGVSLIGVA